MTTKTSQSVAETRTLAVKADDESFVVDERAALRPSEHVQTKLMTVMPAVAVPVSSLHTRRDTRRYPTS
jgi:hypothetical protein